MGINWVNDSDSQLESMLWLIANYTAGLVYCSLFTVITEFSLFVYVYLATKYKSSV